MNKFYTHKIKINKEQNQIRLDQALTKYLDRLSRSQIKILLKNKNVEKKGIIITDASYKVKEGEEYLISIPQIQQSTYQPENIPLNIKYEDEDIIIVNKTAGMVTHPSPGNISGTLVHALLNHTKNKFSSIKKNWKSNN